MNTHPHLTFVSSLFSAIIFFPRMLLNHVEIYFIIEIFCSLKTETLVFITDTYDKHLYRNGMIIKIKQPFLPYECFSYQTIKSIEDGQKY